MQHFGLGPGVRHSNPVIAGGLPCLSRPGSCRQIICVKELFAVSCKKAVVVLRILAQFNETIFHVRLIVGFIVVGLSNGTVLGMLVMRVGSKSPIGDEP